MIRMLGCMLALLIFLVPFGTAGAAPDRDVLYQVSTIDALMAGLYDGTMSLRELAAYGDFGVGTFDKLNGEMMVLDGTVYQAAADGGVQRPTGTMTTPFAAVTFFDADRTETLERVPGLAALGDRLDVLLPSKNLFYAIRIDGTFGYVKTRSVPPQRKPYAKLVEVTAHQPIFELRDVKGTLIVLRCPAYVRGVNVPGYHMHFLTADRTRGGHVLDCSLEQGTVRVDTTPRFTLSLPNSEEFYRTDLGADLSRDLRKVE